MPLIPTRVVDKNGRATTVHKRSGSPAVQARKIATVKPVLTGAKSKKRIDETFSYDVDTSFASSRIGTVLNQMFPDRALDEDFIAKDGKIHTTTREVYTWVSKGFTPLDGIYWSHFKVTDEDVATVLSRIEAMGQRNNANFKPRPWADVIIANDISHKDFLKALANGLTLHDLDISPAQNAPDIITAYGYKGLTKTSFAQDVRDGKIAWEDIKALGVTRAVKYEWTISSVMSDALAQDRPYVLDYPTLSRIIRDVENNPRTSYELGQYTRKTDHLIEVHARYYRTVGEKLWDMHMPEIVGILSKDIAHEDDLEGYAAYCDQVVHQVRSDAETLESIVSVKGEASRAQPGGSYAGQYPKQRDPIWDFKALVEFRDAGLSVDQTVYALTKGLDPVRAKGVLHNDIPLAVNDGWL